MIVFDASDISEMAREFYDERLKEGPLTFIEQMAYCQTQAQTRMADILEDIAGMVEGETTN